MAGTIEIDPYQPFGPPREAIFQISPDRTWFYRIPGPVGRPLDDKPVYRPPAGNETALRLEAELEAFEEKAAIIEFESGLVDHIADDAERRAMAEKIALETGMTTLW